MTIFATAAVAAGAREWHIGGDWPAAGRKTPDVEPASPSQPTRLGRLRLWYSSLARRPRADWVGQIVGFVLSLLLGGLGLLLMVEWREVLMLTLERLAVYPFSVAVIEKVFLVTSGLALLVAILVLHNWFSDGHAMQQLGRRTARAIGVAGLSFFCAHAIIALLTGLATWGPLLVLPAAELVAGAMLLTLSVRRPPGTEPS